MANLLKDVWTGIGCVRSRLLWFKVKKCLAVVYGHIEGKDEERERIWSCVDIY